MSDEKGARVSKSDEEWRHCLTPEQYQVLRRHGTEHAFTGEYHDSKEAGTYKCAGCGAPLFTSSTKFDSGTGWPSFWEPIDAAAVGTKTDRSFFMTRTEVLCAACDGHLGHVFEDGPSPPGSDTASTRRRSSWIGRRSPTRSEPGGRRDRPRRGARRGRPTVAGARRPRPLADADRPQPARGGAGRGANAPA